jgi:hypothetical protein
MCHILAQWKDAAENFPIKPVAFSVANLAFSEMRTILIKRDLIKIADRNSRSQFLGSEFVNIFWFFQIIRWTTEEPIDMRTLIFENDRKFECFQKERHNLRCKIALHR